jgi:hypothetical protein
MTSFVDDVVPSFSMRSSNAGPETVDVGGLGLPIGRKRERENRENGRESEVGRRGAATIPLSASVY